jgi:hypothetical protein
VIQITLRLGLLAVRPFMGILARSVVVTVLAAAIVIVPATWLGAGLVEGLRAIFERLVSGRPLMPSPPTAKACWPSG